VAGPISKTEKTWHEVISCRNKGDSLFLEGSLYDPLIGHFHPSSLPSFG